VSGSVLLVDDDQALREMLEEILLSEGFRVTCTSNGLEALEVLRAGLRPGVILLDLMMPVMDGFAFREEQLRDSALANIPVVVFTAAQDWDERIDATAHVKKPFELEDLLATLQAIARL
jgi:CheY-like chemotaxis protein